MNKNFSCLLLVTLGIAFLLSACAPAATAIPAEGPVPPPETPAPPNGENGIPVGWKIAGGVVAAVVILYWLNSGAGGQWQNEAKEQKPPSKCQEGTYYVHREKATIKPGRWKVTALKVTIDPGGPQPGVYSAPVDLVNQIDQAARRRLLRGKPAEAKRQAEKIGKELTALVIAWQSVVQSRKQNFHVEVHLEGGEASVKFVRYRCVGTPGKWQKESEWTTTLTALDHQRKTFRGPQSKETKRAYKTFLNENLSSYMLSVIEEAGKIF